MKAFPKRLYPVNDKVI